jgi:hypothetical protein
MKPRAPLLLASSIAAAAALCGGCAVYPNAPPAYGGYGYDDGGYGYGGGYDASGYGYAPAPPNVYLGVGGYSGPGDPYWRRGYHDHGDWNHSGNWHGNGHPPQNNPAPAPRAGGGGPPGGGGGGHPPPSQGPRGGGHAPDGRSVDISPNNGSRATNH